MPCRVGEEEGFNHVSVRDRDIVVDYKLYTYHDMENIPDGAPDSHGECQTCTSISALAFQAQHVFQ